MSRFELCKFTPAPDSELICGICMNVLDTPEETPCRHVFCRDCILTAMRENQKCPICRGSCPEGQTKKVLPLVQSLINKLTMRCDYFDNGCTDLILNEFFLDHVRSCEFEMVQCRYKSCGQSLLRRDCEQHELNTCAYRDRVCENECGLMIPQETASSHKCVEALVELVKDLKEKNQDLQKRINELQHASESVAHSETSVAVPASQRNDNVLSFHYFPYSETSVAVPASQINDNVLSFQSFPYGETSVAVPASQINDNVLSFHLFPYGETSVAVPASQRNDNVLSFQSFPYGNIPDSSFNDTSSLSTHSWDYNMPLEAAWSGFYISHVL